MVGLKYWSKLIVKQYNVRCLAVDIYYSITKIESSADHGIVLYNDYFTRMKKNPKADMLWMCDVYHHLDEATREKIIGSINEMKYKYIVMKDIDGRKKVGNLINMIHDLLINHELVHDVNPDDIISMLKKSEYDVWYYDIPKLWYPHFMIIASLKEKI